MKITTPLMIALVLLFGTSILAQDRYQPTWESLSKYKTPDWFRDAKFGIFIHWGMYGVKDVSESWSFHNRQISYNDYMDQMKGFTASRYNPESWAALIKESGARYAVITTKHHDGLALWPTRQDHYSVVKNTPAKRDLLAPFYKALDKEGIKRGA